MPRRPHRNTKESADEARLQSIKLLMRDLVKYKTINKSLKPTYNYRFNTENKFLGYEYLSEIIRDIRKKIHRLSFQDALERKASIIGINKEYYEWYEDSYGNKSRRKDSIYTQYKREEVKNYVIVSEDTLNCSEHWNFNTHLYWADEMRAAIKDPSKTLHNKLDYLRKGDEFFLKEEYFEYEGNIYKKTEFGIQDGKLVDLSKVVKIETNSMFCYSFRKRNGTYFSKDYFLESEKDETFFDLKDASPSGAFLAIYLGYSDSMNAFLNTKFVTTMLVSDNKRFFTSNGRYLYLTKKQVAGLELKPSENHKKIYKEIESEFLEFFNKDSSYSDSNMNENIFRHRVVGGIFFHVVILNNHTGLFGQILKELFPKKKSFGPLELKTRLDILRELLLKEKEYAKPSQAN